MVGVGIVQFNVLYRLVINTASWLPGIVCRCVPSMSIAINSYGTPDGKLWLPFMFIFLPFLKDHENADCDLYIHRHNLPIVCTSESVARVEQGSCSAR